MMKVLAVFSLAAILCHPLAAHHSFGAEYDATKPVTLTGVVTKVEWTNPHSHFFMDVKDDSNATSWEVDMGSPNLQLLNGWKIDTYRPGSQVKVELHPARDGSNLGYGMKVIALRR